MANLKYFADQDGMTVELTNIWHDGHISISIEHFSGLTPAGVRVAVTRRIEYKSHPSRHECDDRCICATGKSMRCECACGGKNHGRGY